MTILRLFTRLSLLGFREYVKSVKAIGEKTAALDSYPGSPKKIKSNFIKEIVGYPKEIPQIPDRKEPKILNIIS